MKIEQRSMSRWQRPLLNVGLSASIVALLAIYPLLDMSALGFAMVVVLLSYLIYWHLADLVLMRRRALLGYVTVPHSHWRERLWTSVWVQMFTSVSAFMLALGALIAAAHLTPLEWALVGLSLLSFSALQRLFRPFILRHIEPAHQAPLLLRLSHLGNLVLLVVAILGVHFWLTEVPDTRHLQAIDVASQAYLQAQDQTQVALIGWLMGINAALYALSWHAIQWVSVGAPWWVTLFVWAVIVGALVLQVSLVWLVLLGAHAWLGRCYRPLATSTAAANAPPQPRQSWAREHVVWALMALFLLVFWWGAERHVAASLGGQQGPRMGADNSASAGRLPCAEADMVQAEQTVVAASDGVRLAQEELVLERLHGDIAQLVDSAYAPAEQVVDAFLDWNFSLAGQYTQLAYLAKAGFNQQAFNALMAERMNAIGEPVLGPAAARAQEQLEERFDERLEQGLDEYYQHLRLLFGSRQALPEAHCFNWQPAPLELPDMLHKSGVGAGFAPGMLLMGRALLPGGAVVARSGGRRAFAALFTRFAARAGTSGSAATVGSVCGPGCSLLAGALVWLGTDLIINYGDEKLNRADMKADILESLYEQREALKHQLQAAATTEVAEVFNAAQQRQEEQFNLSRELQQRQQP